MCPAASINARTTVGESSVCGKRATYARRSWYCPGPTQTKTGGNTTADVHRHGVECWGGKKKAAAKHPPHNDGPAAQTLRTFTWWLHEHAKNKVIVAPDKAAHKTNHDGDLSLHSLDASGIALTERVRVIGSPSTHHRRLGFQVEGDAVVGRDPVALESEDGVVEGTGDTWQTGRGWVAPVGRVGTEKM